MKQEDIDAELVRMHRSSDSVEKQTVTRARNVLHNVGLDELSTMTVKEIRKIPNCGKKTADLLARLLGFDQKIPSAKADEIKPMLDITGAEHVEITVRADASVVWVNVDGICRLRVCRIKHVHMQREGEKL